MGNRRVLDDQLPALAAGAATGRPLLVTIVSIRHLSEINETLGYEYGDGLLGALGSRLREQVGDRAVPARLGGAEIALLQPFDGHLARAEQSVRDLLAAVATPVRVSGRGGGDRAVRGRGRRRPMHATDRPRPAALRRRRAAPGQGHRVRGRGLRRRPGHWAGTSAPGCCRSSSGRWRPPHRRLVPAEGRSGQRGRGRAGGAAALDSTRSTACWTRRRCARWRPGPA